MAFEQMTPQGSTVDTLEFSQQAPVTEDRSFLVPPFKHHLPPRESRIYPDQPIPTPVDEFGFVDVPALIRTVKSTVEPGFRWPRGRRNESTHHIYYEEQDYAYDGTLYSPGVFRNLKIHQFELPRMFENWLHVVMEKPPMPNREVMEYRIRAYRVARLVFDSARNIIVWERRNRRREEVGLGLTEYPDDFYAFTVISKAVGKHLRGLERHLTELEAIPQEFRFVEPANNPDELAQNLGQFVRRQSLLAGRYVHDDFSEAA